ncbi:hypothetical protein [Singulisphaera acidiphila]|uniref:Uncharacterized protein n=1 Tax=Singulisphaera acidiphila (strain ATCC BAA-1392 / DSM 18658 / VKM B-2454 / MOB10) TaxID=886293 RepID=L0D9V0_SINAD|nr:hypothetical protein [Singulisphaera acidiphila]AGA25613.1 hypothetical protein Sinac_1224 [Singulisphaera acidiphila DSM 18658]
MYVPVVLHVRTNVDWGSMTEENFLRQEEFSNSVRSLSDAQKEEFLRAIRLWNRTFGMSYFAYRQGLKEIAELSWTRVRNLDLVLRRPELFPALEGLDPCILMPVDDDDWFHPDAADVLRRSWSPGFDAFHWPDGLYRSVPFQERFDRPAAQVRLVVRRWDSDFTTNGYAITRKGLAAVPGPMRKRVLAFHWAAGKAFHREGVERCFVDQVLSASNKSLASATNLKALVDRPLVLRNVPHLRRRTEVIPPALQWAADYIARTERLNEELCHGLTV